MKTISHSLATIALGAFLSTACGGDDPTRAPDAGGGNKTFHQIEHLARPGINEALLISHAFLAGYNATAPSFAGVPDDVLGKVVAEAKTVLMALYLGGCLLNAAMPANEQLKPAGITCHATGGAIFTDGKLTGDTLTQASKDAAKAYADKVFAQFEPDVMRVDITGDSQYLTPCKDLDTKPL